MKLEGSLDAFSLPDVFQLLSLTKKTGGLYLRNGLASGIVHFSAGAVTGATADRGRQALARRIVGVGAVDDAALRRAVERSSTEGVGVARALLEAGAVDPEVLRALVAEQAVDAVFDLLRWQEGDFAFEVDEPNPDDVGVSLAADQLVAEATGRRGTWDAVSRVVPSPDVVLVMAALPGTDPDVSREDWSLLALVDGHRTVSELVEVSGAGQFAVVSALAGMVQRGLLVIKDEDSPDHVALVRRRQLLLASLESADESTQPPAEAVPVLDTAAAPDELPDQEAATPPQATDVPAAAEPPVEPLVGGAHQPHAVVPPRPEPFLPRRQPAHPEKVPATAARAGVPAYATSAAVPAPSRGGPSIGSAPSGGFASGGATAVATAADSVIDRDPTVNRSLLLRLIAGVRGL